MKKKYRHPENRDKPYVDWRSPKLRKECFFRLINWRYDQKDGDDYTWTISYSKTSKSPTNRPMTLDQKIWFSWLFGLTYQPSMSWVFYWHFPDFEKIDLAELDRWNRETMPRQVFEVDCRYNKGHIVKMVRSLQELAEERGGGSLRKAIESYIDGDPVASFHRIYEASTTRLLKFGRMMSWLFTQALAEVGGLPIRPDTFFVNHPSNHSVWNGMCFLYGKENLTVGHPPYAGHSPTPEDRDYFSRLERGILSESRRKVSTKNQEFLSYFTMESMVCQYKKLHIGHEFPGANLGSVVTAYRRLKKLWPEVDFSSVEETMNGPAIGESIRWIHDVKPMNALFAGSGQLIHLNAIYPEFPDMYLELGIRPEDLRGSRRQDTTLDFFSASQESDDVVVDNEYVNRKVQDYLREVG